MTQISNFRINTHFTALKQLPDLYQMSISFGRSIASGTTDLELAREYINVPAGAYVETTLISSSLDGNIYHLAHGDTKIVANDSSGACYVTFGIEQQSASQYLLIARASNKTSRTVTIPSTTVNAYLRLAIAPFDV